MPLAFILVQVLTQNIQINGLAFLSIPTSYPLWRAPNPTRRGSRRDRHRAADERTTSPHVAPPNPALHGRRRDRPRGRERVLAPASCPPVARPEPCATRKLARSTSGSASAPHPPMSRRRIPALSGRRRDRQRGRERVRLLALCLPWRDPNPARRGSRRDRRRGRQAHHIPSRCAAEPSAAWAQAG